MRSITIVMTTAALLATAGAPAAARTRTADIAFDDLDLSTARGMQALEWRIQRAVEAVCPEQLGLRSAKDEAALRQCRQTVRTSTEQQLTAVARRQGIQLADANRSSN